jgi:tRNA threonylcarbamoyladenosine biosynthesis protein TsaB
MEIAIDTSSSVAGIAISDEGRVIAELTWDAGRNHTAELMPNLIHLLRQVRLDLKSIDFITVARGPGSFNGLRVGMSSAKGLAFALGVHLVGISTLEVEAFPFARTTLPICPILSAGRGEIAAALFQEKGGIWTRLLDEHVTDVDSLLSGIKGRTMFCGEIPHEVAMQLKSSMRKNALILSGAARLRRAGYLAELGWERIKQGDFDHSPTLQPLYLKKPSITIGRRMNAVPPK